MYKLTLFSLRVRRLSVVMALVGCAMLVMVKWHVVGLVRVTLPNRPLWWLISFMVHFRVVKYLVRLWLTLEAVLTITVCPTRVKTGCGKWKISDLN